MVYSRAECVFIPEHYFGTKSFAALRQAFSNAFPDNRMPNKSTGHGLVKKIRDTGSFSDEKHVWHRTVLADVKMVCEFLLKKKN
jgi:hypothetical protein